MITVLFSTYNGENTLSKVLNAYSKIDYPKNDWKLVIINNGSNDRSKDIICSFKSQINIKLLYEKKRGKNIALNTGLSEIEEGLVVFTDDDVVPFPNWLKELKLAEELHPGYTIFGGAVLPEWQSDPEDWILSWVKLQPVFAILDNIKEDGPIDVQLVFGPNMAVRSEIFKMGYKFDETIGPKGLNYAMGSEAELLIRLGKDGFKAWHCNKAKVKHIIRSHQITKNWVLSRAIRFGRGQYRLGLTYPKDEWPIFGVPARCCFQILKKFSRYSLAILSRNEERMFKERWDFNYYLGMAIEARLVYKENIQ